MLLQWLVRRTSPGPTRNLEIQLSLGRSGGYWPYLVPRVGRSVSCIAWMGCPVPVAWCWTINIGQRRALLTCDHDAADRVGRGLDVFFVAAPDTSL